MAALAEYGPVGVQFASVCRAAKVPLFVHFHGYDGSLLLRDSVVVRNYGRLFRLASGIIAPSRFLAKNLLAIGCPPDKLHVIPYGIDPTRLTITRRDPQRILAVGRLVDKKAPHLTIRAFGQIASDYPKAQLDMLGDGPLAETCSSLITDLGLEGRVRMHGAQPHSHVVQLMGEASIFVQHSVTAANGDTEGLPVAILEAMASALPVVATRHSGIPEAVVDGTTGLLVEEHDVDAMASALSQLLADPELGEHMGLAGRKRALDQFAQQRSIDRFRTIMGLPTLATGGLASPCLDGANRCGEASCDQQA
jgi:colanic acid/amylovoran biosynthesis glycosyltransferase